MLSKEDALDAVLRHIQGHEGLKPVDASDTAQLTWRSLLQGQILRCIESREEQEKIHYGRIDLSDRPEYTSLQRYRLAPPRDPGEALMVKLVRKESIIERSCDCSNGKVSCPRCRGVGELSCEPKVVCAGCRGEDSCLRCEGTGRPVPGPDNHRLREDEGRVTCKLCGAEHSACPGCRGTMRTTCRTCGGAGTKACPNCGRAGLVNHERCQGAAAVTTWIEGIIRRRPVTEQIKWPQSGLPLQARKRAERLGAWRGIQLATGDTLPREIADEFGQLLGARFSLHKGEIARKATLRYLPLARVVVSHQPNQIYYVCPGKAEPVVITLPSQRLLWRIAAIAIPILALLVVLSRLIT